MGAVVIGLALVAGGAFAVVRGLGGSAPSLPFGPTELKVTGEPPGTAGTWASGTRRAWRIPATHYSTFEEGDSAYSDTATVTATSWSVTDFIGDTSHIYYGLDPATGKLLWSDGGYRACAPDELAGVVPCVGWVKGKNDDDYDPALQLVDWRTGDVRVTSKFSELGISADLNPASTVEVVDGEILLSLPDYPNGGGDYLGDLAGVVGARVSADGRSKLWEHKASGCEDSTWFGWHPQLNQGVVYAGYGLVLDAKTGASVLDDALCGVPAAKGVVRASGKHAADAPSSVKAPDGTTLFVTRKQDGLQLSGTDLSSVALEVANPDLTTAADGTSRGTGGLTAFDPATGQASWSTPVPVEVYADSNGTMQVGRMLFDDTRLILRTGTTLQALDAQTGAVLWSRPDPGGYGQLTRAADGTIFADSNVGTDAYDPEDGTRLWQVDGSVTLAPDPDGAESLLLFRSAGSDTGVSSIERLVPADRQAKGAVAPSGLPGCPSGMNPVSWTQYSDGAILLCAVGDRLAVVVANHPDWQAGALTFTAGGHEVVFTNGTRIRVSLGGSVVYVDTKGTVTGYPATASWSNATGKVKVGVPATLRTCPGGSWPISLSTFDGGWLLVCGRGPQQPGSMVYADGTTLHDVGSVTYRNGAYCGTGDLGTVCGYRAPAVVSVTPAGGRSVQHSATSNYFSGHGAGGAGEGTGSYGVNTPDDNAKDQVRYLTQILQKSGAGRANIDKAVGQVRACESLNEAITTMNGVVTNRQELLDALDSTPVDAVPNGAPLVDWLRTALDLSHRSDLVWVQWAQAQQANGCADGEENAYYLQVRQLNNDVATAKDDFLRAWNGQIAPAFGAPTFTRARI